MLQTMMQQNMLLYGMGLLCILGMASQIWLWGIYGRMTKDMENERGAKGKLVKQIRQRYSLLKRMGDGNINTSAFIRKSLCQYRYLGRNLHQWRRMGGIALGACLVLGGIGWYLSGTMKLPQTVGQNYLWAMGLSLVLTAMMYGLTDIRYRRSYLETGLLDMLENTGMGSGVQKVKVGIGQEEGNLSPSMETVAASSEKIPFRKGKKTVRETKAQQDKKELKENLSRIKASMGEAAAGVEKDKERNAEILKNMDPAEQERIIREVLKEFLS